MTEILSADVMAAIQEPIGAQQDTPTEPKPVKRGRGRPPKARTVQREIVSCEPPACPKCYSTDHTPYRLVTRRRQAGRTKSGHAYTTIVYRDCNCRKCGQARRVTFFEFEA